MLESSDYKELVLQVLWDKHRLDRLTCELRLLLFSQAVAVDSKSNNPNCLMPFPACFFDRTTKTKCFYDLEHTVKEIPKLDDIREETELPKSTWELLHWVFTNPLSIQPLTNNIEEVVGGLRTLTNLHDIPLPDNKEIFLFKILPSRPKEKFDAGIEEFGSVYAFHGSKLENFHSIIHRGLVSALNKRSAYGFGTYLSNQLTVSKAYSPYVEGFVNCGIRQLGLKKKVQCVAIVEVVNDPSFRSVKFAAAGTLGYYQYHVVNNDDYMQLSHLLLFVQ